MNIFYKKELQHIYDEIEDMKHDIEELKSMQEYLGILVSEVKAIKMTLNSIINGGKN